MSSWRTAFGAVPANRHGEDASGQSLNSDRRGRMWTNPPPQSQHNHQQFPAFVQPSDPGMRYPSFSQSPDSATRYPGFDQSPHPDSNYPSFLQSPDSATRYPAFTRSPDQPMSSTPATTATPHNQTCRFIHTQCDEELFSAEYLRSNKASGHKNLRCFPHCCGGHNPKSFCGAGLVVECSLPRAQIALGCYEEVPRPTIGLPNDSSDELKQNANTNANTNDSHANDRIIVGNDYSRRELFQELKSSDHPFGKWFKGASVFSSTDAQRFQLNGNRQSWHYGWQSSRLNCKNLHVFKVYFFQAYDDAVASNNNNNSPSKTLRCIATLSSPPFRISSSRKARKTFKSSPSMQSLGSISDDQLSMPQSSPRLYEDDDDRMSVDSTDSLSSLPLTLRSRSSFDFSDSVVPTLRRQSTASSTHSSSRVDVLPSLASRLSRRDQYNANNSNNSNNSNNLTNANNSNYANNFNNANEYYRGQPDRKRLTRSSSLQTDYYTAASFATSREPRARTWLGEEYVVPGSRTRMLSLTSLLNADATPTFASTAAAVEEEEGQGQPPPRVYETHTNNQHQHHHQLQQQQQEYRPWSLPPITVPPPSMAMPMPMPMVVPTNQYSNNQRGHHVSTPVDDMMQLKLQTPTSCSSSRGLVRAASASVLTGPSRPQRTGGGGHRARRKRNRSTDSGKMQPAANSGNTSSSCWWDGPIVDEIAPDGEWDLVSQAHALGLVAAIVSRVTRVPVPVATQATTTTNNNEQPGNAYQVTWKTSDGNTSVATITAESKPTLARLCGVLLDAASTLIHGSSFLLDLRAKMHELSAQRTLDDPHQLATGYESILQFVMPQVDAQLALAMAKASSSNQGNATYPCRLIELICSAERELVNEPWFRDLDLFEDDDDEYPFFESFLRYTYAVRGSAVYRVLPLTGRSDSLTLTGQWRLLVPSSLDTLTPSSLVATWSPTTTSWLTYQLEVYECQVYGILETASTLTLTLGNSLLSSACPFTAQLGHQQPVAMMPMDHFPFALTRRQLLLAYRAWRVQQPGGSGAIVVQSMQWPTEADCRVVNGRRQLMRMRLTTYLSFAATTNNTNNTSPCLQVHFVVESCVTDHAKLCAMAFAPPNEADMLEYFNAPATWELLAQATRQYERME